MLAKLFPWFPLAGKTGDLIVVLLGLATVVVIAMLLAGKRQK